MQDISQYKICVQRFHYDIKKHDAIMKNMQVQKAVFMNSAVWDKGSTITVSFFPIDDEVYPEWYDIDMIRDDNNQNNRPTDPIEYIVRKMDPETAFKYIIRNRIIPIVPELNIKFVESNGMVRVRFDKTGGSSSLVGKQCFTAPQYEHTLTLGWLDVGTMIHEFSHALGMLHEHQNPRGNKIQWNRPAVYEWARTTQGWDKETTDINILNDFPLNEVSGSNYDPDSIMLYFFPSDLTLNGIATKMNHVYSDTDKQWLGTYYGTNKMAIQDESALSSSKNHKHNYWPIVIICIILVIAIIILFFVI